MRIRIGIEASRSLGGSDFSEYVCIFPRKYGANMLTDYGQSFYLS